MIDDKFSFDEATHTYYYDGFEVPSVTQIMKNAGIIDDRFYNEEARIRGSAVHLATQYLDEGDLDWDSLDDLIVPYVKAYQKFKLDSGFVPEFIEKRIYHKAKPGMAVCIDYAGTLDRAGIFADFLPQKRCDLIRDKYAVIDLKTGSIPEWAGIQLAAYALGLLPKMPRRFALLLKKDGKYKLQEFKKSSDYGAFYGACHMMVGSKLIKGWRDKHG